MKTGVFEHIAKKVMLFVAKATSFPILFIFFRCRIIKAEKYSPNDIRRTIIYANHSSYLDPLLLLYTFPFNSLKFVINRTVIDSNMFLKWVLNTVGCVIIDKEDFAISDLNRIVNSIDDKSTLVIFPEGYIHRNEPVNEFKSGLALLAYYLRLPARPVYLRIPDKMLARKTVIVGKNTLYADIDVASKQVFDEIGRIARNNLLELKNMSEGK